MVALVRRVFRGPSKADDATTEIRTILLPQPAKAYFERLDAVRGAAILGVFAFHFCGACWSWRVNEWLTRWEASPPWLAWPGMAISEICRLGWLGVPVFFVLSGFLIHYTYSRGSNQSVGQFWLRRFGRIYPPYLVSLLLLSLVLGQMWRVQGRTNVLHHLLLIHNYRDEFIFRINGSFWSLAVEAQYYLLYPLLLGIRRVIGMHAVLGTALLVKLALPLLISAGVIPNTPDTVACLMMPERYFEWILGMYVADRLLTGRPAFPLHWTASWACFGGAVFVDWMNWTSLLVVPLASAGAAIWVDHVVRSNAKPLRIERLLFPIGVVSYSLYLWHQPIIAEVVKRIVNNQDALRTLTGPGAIVVALVVSAAVSALVSAGSYRLTEVPSMELTKRLIKRLPPAPATKESKPDETMRPASTAA